MSAFNILVAGVGGQGVLLTSKILAEAALLAGLDVKQSEVHGMAQRGGSVLSQVRLGDKVYSPIMGEGECDLIIGFEPVETARYIHFLKENGKVIYNTHRVASLTVSIGAEKYPEDIDSVIASRVKTALPLDATALAAEAGERRAVNLVLLGAAMEYLPLSEADVYSAIRKSVPVKSLEMNEKAFLAGTRFKASQG
ncbi:MAG: indolepyruvate oxidoreductase subunit beta [Nitrospirota bacterium]